VRNGFLLIGRQDRTNGLPGADRPTVALSRDQIHVNYRGIEGEPWPQPPASLSKHLVNGLLPASAATPARRYYDMVAAAYLCDLIYIEPFTHMGGEVELPRDFVVLGFDFGVIYVSEDYIGLKSRVYTDVIFGDNDELREMAGDLNDNLLFKDNRTLKLFSRTLTRMMSTKDTEMPESSFGEGFTIYGLPADKRIVTNRYVETASFLE
jgi:hypothetical protein